VSNTERLEESFRQDLLKSAEIPNAPFLYEPARRFVINELVQMGFVDAKSEHRNQQLEYVHDDFALYAKIKRRESKHKLIITTHLDHPFVVLDGKGGGTPLGSIGNDRLKKQTETKGIPVKVYSKDGELVASDTIVGVNIGSRRTRVITDFQEPYGTNSHAIWAMEPFVVEGGRIKMINSDNMANTAIMLSLIEEIVQDTSEKPIDVEFIFAYLEEIKQVSTTAIALRGSTPFGGINSNSLIVVLESASVETLEEYEATINSLQMRKANYDDGIIVRINDRGLVYGQRYDTDNKAENLLLMSAQEAKANYQQTLLSGTCDATSYTLFSKTPHIASITIPTKYKHNTGKQGEMVREEILIRDVNATKNTLLKAIYACGGDLMPIYRPDAHSRALKSTSMTATPRAISELKRDRIATYFTSLQRLKRARFYPENISDRMYFSYNSAVGKVKKLI